MKNTRIARLKQSKRVKQATKLLTVGLLVCPLAIGTIKALAEESETTPTAEQVEETTATTEEVAPVEETETSEPVQPEVNESSQTTLPEQTEQATEATTTTESTIVEAEEVAPSKEYQEVFGRDIDRTALESAYNTYNGLNEADYTPESWTAVMEKINGPFAGGWSLWDGILNYYNEGPNDSLGMDGPEYDDQEGGLLGVLQSVRDMFANNVLGAIGELVKAPAPAEDVTYYVMFVDENGFAIDGAPDVTKTAKKGSSVTETAPEVENFFVLGDNTQTQTIGDNTIFTFTYRRLMATGLFHDVIGDTTAKVGESKTYQYNEVMYYNNGTMTETVIDIATYHIPLTSSDPSDVIVGGTVTFGSEGTRTLIAQNSSGAPLEVTVTKDSVDPEIPVEGIFITKQSMDVDKGYSENLVVVFTPENASNKGIIWSSSNDSIVSVDENGKIIAKSKGTALITATSVENSDATSICIVSVNDDTPPVTDVDTTKLESSIKDAEAKLTAGGYTAQSVNALKQALQNAKDVLANASSTQAEIDEAQKALDLAIAGLVKEDNSSGGNTGNNGSNGTGNSSNNPNTSNNGAANTNNQTNSNKQNSTTTTTKPAGNNTNKDGLPQTGEQSTTNAVIAGLSLTMLSIFAWFKKKKV